jgi:hypothetical protein
MANSNLIPLAQTLIVDQVADVIVSAVLDDGTGTGTFVRAISVFGAPNGTSGPAVFVLQIKSTTAANLDIATPTLTF